MLMSWARNCDTAVRQCSLCTSLHAPPPPNLVLSNCAGASLHGGHRKVSGKILRKLLENQVLLGDASAEDDCYTFLMVNNIISGLPRWQYDI